MTEQHGQSETETPAPAGAVEAYRVAYEAHYGEKRLADALAGYNALIASHPDSPEAGYGRSQIANILKSVVPKEDLLARDLELARSWLQRDA